MSLHFGTNSSPKIYFANNLCTFLNFSFNNLVAYEKKISLLIINVIFHGKRSIFIYVRTENQRQITLIKNSANTSSASLHC